MTARWSRAEVFAAIAAAVGPAFELPSPHAMSIGDGGGRGGDRVGLWFEFDDTAAVDRWLAHLLDLGAGPEGPAATGRVYPADVDFRVYRAEIRRWAGWRWTFSCRVREPRAAVAS